MNLGSKPRDSITLTVGGSKFEYWKNIVIRSSIYTLASEFQLSASTLTKGESFPIEAGAPCVLHLGDAQILTGYIDSVSKQRDSGSTQVSISGRDKTADLIDSSARAKKSTWNHVKLEDIASDLLSPFGIKLVIQAPTGDKFSSWSISQGESVFECLERAATLRGLFLTTNPEGDLVIRKFETHSSHQTSMNRLSESEILSLTIEQDFRGRFHTIEVISQLPPELGSKMGSDFITKAEVADSEVKRNRTLQISAEGLGAQSAAKQRAQYEMNVRIAKSTRIQASAQGFKSQIGKPWSVGDSVHLASKLTGEQSLIVTSLEFSLDDQQGSRTQLELQSPSALAFDPTQRLQSNPYLNLMQRGGA